MSRLRLTLTVSPEGEVIDARPSGEAKTLKLWPQVQAEVRNWKFRPFKESGDAVTAEVEEYLYLIPAERLPTRHVIAPAVRADSTVEISLTTWGCMSGCPMYTVTIGTNGIVFQGERFVAVPGRHTSEVNADEVRKLAKTFIDADFYSMDEEYEGLKYDVDSYELSITIDGQKKKVTDCLD